MKEDIKHTIILSGGGFHPYVFTKPLKIEDLEDNKIESHLKFILKNAQHGIINIINKHLSKEDKITYGYQKTCDIDSHVIGDIGRIARIPNTWHPKRKRYAIPIIESDFDKTFKEILILSKNQRSEYEVFGNKLIDLKGYDMNFQKVQSNNVKLRDNGHNLKDLSGVITLLPKFIQTLLATKDDGCRARYYTIVSMKVRGFPKSVSEDLCEKHWSPDKFKHALYGHGYSEFDYIYGRHDIFFPNWQTLINEGWNIPEEDINNYKLMYNR